MMQAYETAFEGEAFDQPVNVQVFATVASLDQLQWFHNITRTAAEALLLKNGEEGSYLMRQNSDATAYAVSVRCKNSVVHYEVEEVAVLQFQPPYKQRNSFKFGIATFADIDSLLDHFKSRPILINDSGGENVVLLKPYNNEHSEMHIYGRVTRQAEIGRATIDSKSHDYCLGSKEGYLIKRGRIRKNWKTRWFVVQKNELSYFKNKMYDKPIRTLDLWNALSVQDDTIDQKENCFSIRFPKRTFYILGTSKEQTDEWVQFLQLKIDHFKKIKK